MSKIGPVYSDKQALAVALFNAGYPTLSPDFADEVLYSLQSMGYEMYFRGVEIPKG